LDGEQQTHDMSMFLSAVSMYRCSGLAECLTSDTSDGLSGRNADHPGDDVHILREDLAGLPAHGRLVATEPEEEAPGRLEVAAERARTFLTGAPWQPRRCPRSGSASRAPC